MRQLVVLGAGTAGTTVVNRLRHRLDREKWQITVVDQDDVHLYQPGLLLLPFGVYEPSELVKPRQRFIPDGAELELGEIDRVDAAANRVLLADGRVLDYDYLVIATGTSPRPDQTPGMAEGQWRKSIFDFYTLDGATALRQKLTAWEGGRLVVHIVEMPIKCPVAPLEFAFLADAFFAERGMRDKVDITTSRRWKAPSPSRSPHGTSAACSPTGRSHSRATSWWTASTRTPRPWCRWTSA